MRLTCTLLLVFLAAACAPQGGTPPDAYANSFDRLQARFTMLQLFGSLCDEPGDRRPPEQCYRFEPPRRWSGIVVHDDYMGNRFYPGRSGLSRDVPQHLQWSILNAPWRRGCLSALCRPVIDSSMDPPPPRAFRVEFIGRRTAYPGRYDHMGISGHMIIIDRLVAEREIDLPR